MNIPPLTQKFIDHLEDKIKYSGTMNLQTRTLKLKVMDTMIRCAEDSKDIKLILLKYFDDPHIGQQVKEYIKTRYPHLSSTVDKLLVLK